MAGGLKPRPRGCPGRQTKRTARRRKKTRRKKSPKVTSRVKKRYRATRVLRRRAAQRPRRRRNTSIRGGADTESNEEVGYYWKEGWGTKCTYCTCLCCHPPLVQPKRHGPSQTPHDLSWRLTAHFNHAPPPPSSTPTPYTARALVTTTREVRHGVPKTPTLGDPQVLRSETRGGGAQSTTTKRRDSLSSNPAVSFTTKYLTIWSGSNVGARYIRTVSRVKRTRRTLRVERNGGTLW